MRESGSRACCSPQTVHSQFENQSLSVCAISYERARWETLCHAPKFFFRKLAVRSHHNSRLFMTKGAAQGLAMGQGQCQDCLLSHASGCKASHRVHTLPYPKMPNGQFCASPSGNRTLLDGGNLNGSSYYYACLVAARMLLRLNLNLRVPMGARDSRTAVVARQRKSAERFLLTGNSKESKAGYHTVQ